MTTFRAIRQVITIVWDDVSSIFFTINIDTNWQFNIYIILFCTMYNTGTFTA